MRACNRMTAFLCIHLAISSALALAEDNEHPLPHRVFPTSRFSIDQILTRPYDSDVPFGCVGNRVWASSPQGWAFRDDVHWLYLTNLKAFDLELRDQHGLLHPARATYYPSHVHLEGAVRALSASASFTFATDNAQNPLTQPFRPEKRWTCWSSKNRQDWYAVDFGSKRRLNGIKVWFFDDAPNGGCRPPENFELERWDGQTWHSIPLAEKGHPPVKGENIALFHPVDCDRVRLVFRNAGANFYTGIYGFELIEQDPLTVKTNESLQITADKFIQLGDVLVSIVRVHNSSDKPSAIQVLPILDWTWTGEIDLQRRYGREPDDQDGNTQRSLTMLSFRADAKLHDFDVGRLFRFAITSDPAMLIRDAGEQSISGNATITPFPEYLRAGGGDPTIIEPRHTKIFTAALELKRPSETSELDRVLAVPARDTTQPPGFEKHDAILARRASEGSSQDLLAKQVADYQSWFDSNVAYFDCSDPWVRKMYYHRAYVLRKNLLDPKLGRMQWKTQSEGRWRSGWYPNVISYGGGHQVREARWLRDSSYAQGHLQTFAENEKDDGVYPSHIKPGGPQGGQYTDWITASAWDAYLNHPDREFLRAIADKLADNVRGWQKVYDPDGDGLLLVDSHWWTGMEYQPSFFYFSNYKPARDFLEPEQKISIDRVDLTAYNFGNATAVARIYREIGQAEKADEFEQLAAKIAHAVTTKMWDSKEKFFYSLRHGDGAKAEVKEVIGVYPFYFGMLPHGTGDNYESIWKSILDPEEFWTPWPVASASKKCPAYSQTNWPSDGRAAGCMWNGPTWPHANSIVMTAMARSIRASRDSAGNGQQRQSNKPLTAENLWDLFYSFTKAQYRDQDLAYPWTGEFYNGETARWKTAERDYNHSTWFDVLIPDVLGLVPRADDLLEVDPLLPAGKFDHFVLDGQHYRGHDVTLVWDAPGGDDHYGDGRFGFDIYLDNKRVVSATELGRMVVDMKSGKRVE